MPILIVILIGWFNWLVYSAHHRITFVQYLHTVVLYKTGALTTLELGVCYVFRSQTGALSIV